MLVEESANFAAPQWFAIADTVVEGQTASSMPAPGESGLLYVIRDENTAQLVLSDEAGDNEQFLTPLARQDFVSFSMNGTGRYIVAAGTFATWSPR
ncbi:MAG: hypothetical protein KDE58_27680 [Caldilineaceae bacterium]|nr:hypothetical protein [Caldilineaceae bacterium]